MLDGNCMVCFITKCKLGFQSMLYHITFPPTHMSNSLSLNPHQHLCCHYFIKIYKDVLTHDCVFILNSHDGSHWIPFLYTFFANCLSFLVNYLSMTFPPFNWGFSPIYITDKEGLPSAVFLFVFYMWYILCFSIHTLSNNF